MDSFLCMHHVGFNVFFKDKSSLTHYIYFLNVYFSKITYTAKTGFLIVVMADRISKPLKPRKTADVF